MKHYKKYIIALTFIVFFLTFSGPVKAGNPFKNYTTTEEGEHTWDSDMINIDDVSETGTGVYIAVLDTGLAPNWRDYFPEERIETKLGIGFYEELNWNPKIHDFEETGNKHTTTFIGSRGTTHGTHVTSTILGYFYDTNWDTIWGYSMPPLVIRGIAPNVKIIPVKVLADYQVPADPKADPPTAAETVVFGTDWMVAAGINYIADLASQLDGRVIISMSLGGSDPSPEIYDAIMNAIDHEVIVVVAAGNSGIAGMDYPGGYPEVISVGAAGWKYEWWWPQFPGTPDSDNDGPEDDPDTIWAYYPFWDARNRLWWLQSTYNDWMDVAERDNDLDEDVYVASFSSRELPGQQLDVLAPGSWVRGPYPGYPGYAHLPWWSRGWGSIIGRNPGNYYYVGGTSMATPHVSALAALMLEKESSLSHWDIESILKSTALHIAPNIGMDIVDAGEYGWGWYTVSWGSDATGAGLVQADRALSAIPIP